MSRSIALDIGGTKIFLGKFSGKNLVSVRKLKTKSLRQQLFFELDKELKSPASKKKQIHAIKISCAGPADYSKGILKKPSNLKPAGFKIVEELRKRYSTKVFFENDASCFALYHAISGKAKKFRIVSALTLGTGIGCGLTISKKPFRGRSDACELAHITLGDSTLEQAYRQLPRKHKFSSFLEAAQALSSNASKSTKCRAESLFTELGRLAALACYNVRLLYDPETIVIGGAVAHAEPLMLKSFNNETKKLNRKFGFGEIGIVFDADELASLKGAALL